MTLVTRRGFLQTAAAAMPAAWAVDQPLGFPLEDFHVHLNPSFTLEDAVALSAKTGVKFGIAEHAGTKENQYRGILTNDRELEQWIAKLDGRPVYKGLQAEWLDWRGCFSKAALAQVDFVLSDAMTIRGRDGQRTKMWTQGFDAGDAQEFMDRYVKWNVEVIETEPLDIFAHPTWLPPALNERYEELWTEARMKPIIAALRRTSTAVEIDSAYRIPSVKFLEMAKPAGLKFSFGSNSGSGPARAIDFCVETARRVGLGKKDMFVPARGNRKPVMRRG